MSATLAAVAIPVAAASSVALRGITSLAGNFGELFAGKSTAPEDSVKEINASSLDHQLEQLKQQLTSRIRNSGVPTSGKVDIQLDEFGLPRAFSNGQENTDLSRWLSGEHDLVRQLSELQSQAAAATTEQSIAISVDLAS